MKQRGLRIAIAAAGRFHVLDLARELLAHGHDVKFYSYVPPSWGPRFGFPATRMVGLLPFVAPLVLWQRRRPDFQPHLRERLMHLALERLVRMSLRPCDVFIGMSGIYLDAPLAAKHLYGARYILERGSRHILDQHAILAASPSEQPSGFTVRRELRGYAAADRISIPSIQVRDSFNCDPSLRDKLVVNPYGVDLEVFRSRDAAPEGRPRLLFVGKWSWQKGVDVLVAAVRRLRGTVELLHVGPLGDVPFPDEPGFTHVEPVAQNALVSYYHSAHLLVLPSRQDGYGMVLNQALATGLPVIGSDHSGAVDLAANPLLRERTWVVRAGDLESLGKALEDVLSAVRHNGIEPVSDAQREVLSWQAYGARYNADLQAMMT